MTSKNYCVVSGILFVLVAAAHLLRILLGLPVQIEDYAVPMYVSWFGMLIPGGLAFWAFRATKGEA